MTLPSNRYRLFFVLVTALMMCSLVAQALPVGSSASGNSPSLARSSKYVSKQVYSLKNKPLFSPQQSLWSGPQPRLAPVAIRGVTKSFKPKREWGSIRPQLVSTKQRLGKVTGRFTTDADGNIEIEGVRACNGDGDCGTTEACVNTPNIIGPAKRCMVRCGSTFCSTSDQCVDGSCKDCTLSSEGSSGCGPEETCMFLGLGGHACVPVCGTTVCPGPNYGCVGGQCQESCGGTLCKAHEECYQGRECVETCNGDPCLPGESCVDTRLGKRCELLCAGKFCGDGNCEGRGQGNEECMCGGDKVCAADEGCLETGINVYTCEKKCGLIPCIKNKEECVSNHCLSKDGEVCGNSGNMPCKSPYCVHSTCRSSPTYCGDDECDPGETCAVEDVKCQAALNAVGKCAGGCKLECKKGFKDCKGVCADLSKDINNCKTCGNKCAAGQTCGDKGCVSSQPPVATKKQLGAQCDPLKPNECASGKCQAPPRSTGSNKVGGYRLLAYQPPRCVA